MPRLRELQRAFFGSLDAYAGAPEGGVNFDPQLLAYVTGSTPLLPADRVRIYGEMYWARIVDALFEDFPRLVLVLGDDQFRALGRAYLACAPSTHPSLRYIGRGFPEFLASRGGELPPFSADLARLEWARLTVFDGLDPRPLRLEELRALGPETWAAVVLRRISACEVLRTAWPVHEIWSASDPAAVEWRPRDTWLRVWRQEFLVYQTSLDECERRALDEIRTQASFADVCAVVAAHRPPDEAAAEAGALLLRWVEDGLIERAA